MIIRIIERKPFITDEQIKNWFDNVGINSLPWNKNESDETDLYNLEINELFWNSIISKANYYPIEINK